MIGSSFLNEAPNDAFGEILTRFCVRCGEEFHTYHRQRKYCPNCRPLAIQARIRKAAAQAKKRNHTATG